MAPLANTSSIGIIAIGLAVGAALAPYFAAVFLLPAAAICGVIAIAKDKLILGFLALLISVAGLLNVIEASNKLSNLAMNLTSGVPTATGLTSGTTNGQAKPTIVVSEAKYNQVSEGMTYSDVRSIIGVAGKQISRSDIQGTRMEIFMWANSNGSNMTLSFIDGKVSSKAMTNLD